MEKESEKESTRGGARHGAGRKKIRAKYYEFAATFLTVFILKYLKQEGRMRQYPCALAG